MSFSLWTMIPRFPKLLQIAGRKCLPPPLSFSSGSNSLSVTFLFFCKYFSFMRYYKKKKTPSCKVESNPLYVSRSSLSGTNRPATNITSSSGETFWRTGCPAMRRRLCTWELWPCRRSVETACLRLCATHLNKTCTFKGALSKLTCYNNCGNISI